MLYRARKGCVATRVIVRRYSDEGRFTDAGKGTSLLQATTSRPVWRTPTPAKAGSLGRRHLRGCPDGIEPSLGTGIVKVGSRRTTHADATDDFPTDLNGQATAED